jgi:TonB family protein
MLHPLLQTQGLPRRAMAAGSIIGLHALLLYLVVVATQSMTIKRALDPLILSILDPPQKLRPQPPPPPPPQHPRLSHPDVIRVVPPEHPIDDPPPPTPNEVTADVQPLPPEPIVPAVPAPDPIRIIGTNRLPNSEDYYPSNLIRDGVEGSAGVRVCVDANGARQGDPVIETSSGNSQLDAGALKIARAGRYARAVQGSTPVPNCFHFRIGFEMKKH